MSLINELNRRNVFRVGVAYLAVAWLIIQVTETIFPLFGFDDGPARLVVIVLAIGFIPALVFAWAFELTPEGLRKEEDVDRSGPTPAQTGKNLDRLILVALALALGYFVFDKFVLDPRRDEANIEIASEEAVARALAEAQAVSRNQSIAVLPFRNRSANEENAVFFSDGVHDELLTNLSRIADLRVISRTSVENYRDTSKNLRQIGEELGVTKILEGGVQRAGGKVRVNVQLIDAATDDQLWGEVYDRELSVENVFAIQTEIARAIANALEATLSPETVNRIAKIPTVKLEAYDNFLMARQLFNRGNNDNLEEAKSRLEKAIEQDPAFVDAWVLLARTHHSLIGKGAASPENIRKTYEEAVQRALALGPENAGALAARGEFLRTYGLEGAGVSFERALQIEPSNVDVLIMYATWLRHEYHFDRALELYQSARVLDPLSTHVLFGMARIYEVRRETEKALETYARIRQIDPSSPLGVDVAGVYVNAGDMVRALKSLLELQQIDPEDSDLPNFIALCFVDFGDLRKARQWASLVESSRNINPMTMAVTAILDIYEDNHARAVRTVSEMLNKQMEERWNSGAVVSRTLLIRASAAGNADVALETMGKVYPELFQSPPRIDAGNIQQATDTAHLLLMQGRNDQAEKLLQTIASAFGGSNPIPATLVGPTRAQALALLGDRPGSIRELRNQVEAGWRFQWRWNTELNPNFASLRDEPEFQALLEFLRSDLARQYEEFLALQASGEIPSGDFLDGAEPRH